MCAQINKEYNISLVLRALEKVKGISPKGEVFFSHDLYSRSFQEYIAILLSTIDFSRQIPDIVRKSIITGAIVHAGKNILSQETFLAEIEKLESNYLKKAPKKYILVTDMSAIYSKLFQRRKIKNCDIVFKTQLSEQFKSERQKFLRWASHHITGQLPSDYLNIQISAFGRSPEEAGSKALDAINLLRAMWNLVYNLKKRKIFPTSKERPLNSIVLGPFHSIHDNDGKHIPSIWWRDTSYKEPLQCKDISKEEKALRESEQFITSKFAKLPSEIREFVEIALLRYVHALDEYNMEASFLKLWSLLEYLTHTLKDRYEVTVKRTAKLFHDYQFHMQILKHLQDRRNIIVHKSEYQNEIEIFTYQIKQYAERLLLFHLVQGNKFENLGGIIEYLDLSQDRTALIRKKRFIELKLKLRKH